jgi:hypothetical protein
VRLAGSLHGHRFFPASASTRSSAPQPVSSPKRDRSLVTAFSSPATVSAFADSIPGSMVLACSFALWLPGSRARSAFRLHRPNRLAPTPAVSLLQTRCTFPGQLIRLLSPSPLPSGSFRSLGIKAFNGRRRHPVRLPNPPDLRSLPDARSIASLGFGSSSAIRYVSGDLLFLKPLGTLLTMPLTPIGVNTFLIVTVPFQQLLFAAFRISYAPTRVHVLWIKRWIYLLF